jgi:uncharacterized protein
MLEILTPDRFKTSPWKNGGGVTHEIARAEEGGRWLWRLSVAEVAADGPFSRFDGLARILTVIEGAGIDLVTPGGVLPARPLCPLAFHGETPVEGKLRSGPIRDLNVIYDPLRIQALVERLDGPADIDAPGLAGFLALGGAAFAEGVRVPVGAFVLGRAFSLQLKTESLGMLVRLQDASS